MCDCSQQYNARPAVCNPQAFIFIADIVWRTSSLSFGQGHLSAQIYTYTHTYSLHRFVWMYWEMKGSQTSPVKCMLTEMVNPLALFLSLSLSPSSLAAGFPLLEVGWQWFMTEGRSKAKQSTIGRQNKERMSRRKGKKEKRLNLEIWGESKLERSRQRGNYSEGARKSRCNMGMHESLELTNSQKNM